MKKIILISSIFFSSVFCIAHFGEAWINAVLVEAEVKHKHYERDYGDLYYMTHIDDFKVKLSRDKTYEAFINSKKNIDLNRAEIVIFGDSFFEINKFVNIPELISDSLNNKLRFIRSYDVLNHMDQASNAKLIIFELSERFFFDVFTEKLLNKTRKANIGLKTKIKQSLFPPNIENRYNLLLKRSYISNDIYNFIMTKRYQLFGLINPNVIQSKTDESVLFLSDYLKSDRANNIFEDNTAELEKAYIYLKEFNALIREKYNCEIQFIIIPNKATIMYPFDRNTVYNQFLPKLYSMFDKDSINYINLYDDFMMSEKKLYFNTDTHWNENAVEITFDKLKQQPFFK